MPRCNSLLALLPVCLFGNLQCHRPSPVGYGSPPIVSIYKTIHDYHQQVSVLLSEDGTELLAFPDPADVAGQRPIALVNGYWLQRMPGNAFLSITIEEYQQWTVVDPQILLDRVVDDEPFIEHYTCSGISSDTDYLNALIRRGHLLENCQAAN